MSPMFHRDNAELFDMAGLRWFARSEADASSLINRCAEGDRHAAVALSLGFWPFVFDFEKAIKSRVQRLPRAPLYAKFGPQATRRTLVQTAHVVKQLQASELEAVFERAVGAVTEMQEEEETHTAHWVKDAKNLGLERAQLESARVVPGVEALVEGARCDDLVGFFAALAATEFMAEELADKLGRSTRYTELFANQRAIWMEVHRVPHGDGPSHLEVDLDLARAYAAHDSSGHVESLVRDTLRLFGAAAREVEAHFIQQGEARALA
jgi:hypothetical protein